MSHIKTRDVGPILQKLRDFLLGRPHVLALRFEKDLATRSPPPPEIPDGPCHGLSKNYYFSRDVRREVMPPAIVASKKGAIGAGGAPVEPDPCKLPPTPGCVYFWDKPR